MYAGYSSLHICKRLFSICIVRSCISTIMYFDDILVLTSFAYFIHEPMTSSRCFSTMHKPPSVVAADGCKPPAVLSGSLVLVTVIGCGNALGYSVPPFFVFPGARMRQELLEGKTPGADGDVTESGWSNSQIFQKYLETHLTRYLPERSIDRPVCYSMMAINLM